MVKGGKVSSKGSFRKRVRSKGGGSDDSDEDYVVSDDAGNVSDCPEDDCFSLDGCAVEDSFDGFIEDEDVDEVEIRRVTKFNRSRAKTGVRHQGKNVSKAARKRQRITYAEEIDEEEEEDYEEVEEEDDDDYNEEEEEEEEEEKEVDEVEEEEEEVKEEVEEVEEEEEEEVEVDENDEDEDFNYDDDEFIPEEEDYTDEEEEERSGRKKKKEDFSYEDEEFIQMEEERKGRKKKKEDFNDEDEEFIPTEEDYTDEEEEETRGVTKKNNGSKMVKKKTLEKRVSAASSRGRKRSGSRVSKKPKRKRRGKSGGSRRKVKCDDDDDADDLFDNGPAIRTNSRKKSGHKRRRVLLEDANSGSDCETRQSDFEFTISEEEKEQVREAMELCGNIRRNLRRASLRMKNEVVEVHEDLYQQRKPPAQKGKEKIEESQGRKGKEKVEELKIEATKQVCGICLSEENKRRVRGILNSCTHYFCFACIMEWSKVESRCPLCKQRFKTISKPVRSTTAQEAVIQVPERDQVYQPTEEELRSYIDPYESVICSECNLGGDDGLMLLCDICDSPAHTYCVGLGREVPEGNWYCDGCRPVALASLNSQAQERGADLRDTTQSQPSRPSPVHIRESIDLNMMSSSPYSSFGQGFGHLSSSRFLGRSAEGGSPMSGGGAPTVSERRRIHRQIQQLRSMDRMTSTTGRLNGVSATSTISNLHSSEIDQTREPTSQYSMTQDVGTSYHTFFEERLGNNISPLMQNRDHFSTRISNSRSLVQDSTMFSNATMNAVIWPGFSGTRTLSDIEPIHPFSSRSNIVTECSSIPPTIIEEDNLHIVTEQLQSAVKSHLKRLSQDTDLDYSTFKDIASSSTHTILAACGLEHKTSEVSTAPPPSICPHIELIAGGQTSMMNGCCSSCFDSFVGDVVKRILDTRMSSQWLRLGI